MEMGIKAGNLTYHTGAGQQEVDGVRRQEGNTQQQGPAIGGTAQTWPRPPTYPSTPLTSPPTQKVTYRLTERR